MKIRHFPWIFAFGLAAVTTTLVMDGNALNTAISQTDTIASSLIKGALEHPLFGAGMLLALSAYCDGLRLTARLGLPPHIHGFGELVSGAALLVASTEVANANLPAAAAFAKQLYGALALGFCVLTLHGGIKFVQSLQQLHTLAKNQIPTREYPGAHWVSRKSAALAIGGLSIILALFFITRKIDHVHPVQPSLTQAEKQASKTEHEPSKPLTVTSEPVLNKQVVVSQNGSSLGGLPGSQAGHLPDGLRVTLDSDGNDWAPAFAQRVSDSEYALGDHVLTARDASINYATAGPWIQNSGNGAYYCFNKAVLAALNEACKDGAPSEIFVDRDSSTGNVVLSIPAQRGQPARKITVSLL